VTPGWPGCGRSSFLPDGSLSSQSYECGKVGTTSAWRPNGSLSRLSAQTVDLAVQRVPASGHSSRLIFEQVELRRLHVIERKAEIQRVDLLVEARDAVR
jgi:hypothetical protein